MLSIFFLFVLILIAIPTAYGQLSDRTGLKQNFVVETGGYEFPVDITSNFNVEEIEFSSDDKKLTFYINSNIEGNIAEIIIPINLINGNFTFILNDQEVVPQVKMNEKISFITIEFDGIGKHKLDIVGTTYLSEFSEISLLILTVSLFSLIAILKLKKFNFSITH